MRYLLIDILKLICVYLLGFVALVVIVLILMCFPQEVYHYEYIDLDNIKGVAKECSYKFENSYNGGQGSPVCELSDGTVKQVKEYKYIYEKTIVPIKEIIGGDNKWKKYIEEVLKEMAVLKEVD